MNDDKTQPQDAAVAEELKGVPEELLEGGTVSLGGELKDLQDQLDAARQEVLYARAETQNVRRRLEKDIADTRAYAATGFARDILSVADNLSRALESIPADLREEEKLKGLISGLEATSREIDKVFVSRGGVRTAQSFREMENEAEIEGIAQELGLILLRPETIPWEEQAKIFSRARVVAGEFGSFVFGNAAL